ncbi:choline/carnitine/betaine transport [Salsuginibacillus halophilus]|uniref:Choline/carnitine/betaine transport n=1 Tax=Salsuginibacillus halophilus TaxID=517424 RepID=A0A2P8HQM9_9BACI|nr:BCCT family transporter [Salsuginibacillus halophilus]PSL48530.1 choline/carnitine/betaine transport [Salsuginibacillus halophilus]
MTQKSTAQKLIDWPVLVISGGLLVLFVLAAVIDAAAVQNFVDMTFGWAVEYFGAFWQILLLATFITALVLGFSKYGRVRLGGMDQPELSTFKWISIIMCTLLAGGGVFWAAAEPMFHFMDVPPVFGSGVESATSSAVHPALAQSFLHWGFLAWAILGTLSTIVLMHAHYKKGLPLKPRTLLYPLFGERIVYNSVWGTIIDASAIISVAAGTIGPIGFLGLQAGYGLNVIFGIPDTYLVQLLIIVSLVAIASISAITGVHRGIQVLSRFNVILTLILIGFILLIGPGGFIIDSFIAASGMYVQEFAQLTTFRGADEWLGLWTVFFWGWFLGYGPMMAIFIARITRGRTIRELVLAIAIIAPIVTNFWFTVVGGSGIFYEMQNEGSVSNALFDEGMHAAMMSIAQQLPLGAYVAFAFLVVTILFVVTTTDSMSYTISMAITGKTTPEPWLRVFWAVVMGAVASVLLYMGEGTVEALQSFIVVAAIPVSLLLLPMIWLGPKAARRMAEEQKIVQKK